MNKSADSPNEQSNSNNKVHRSVPPLRSWLSVRIVFSPVTDNPETENDYKNRPDEGQANAEIEFQVTEWAGKFFTWIRSYACKPNMAEWLLVAVGLATFLAAAKYASITARQWQTAKDTLEVQSRPWIGLDEPITIDFLQLAPRLVVASHYKIKNFGYGPARKVVVNGWFETDTKTLPNTAEVVCAMATDFSAGTVPLGPNVPNPGPMGYTLFPGQPHAETIGSPSSPWQGEAMPDLKHFWFIGCTVYVDPLGKSHWTRFCMEPDSWARHPIDKHIPLTFCALYNDTGDGPYPHR